MTFTGLTDNATIYTDALEALWTHIEAHAAFPTLGLTVYRGYDGQQAPSFEDGAASLDASDLPLLHGIGIAFDTETGEDDVRDLIVRYEIELVYHDADDSTPFHSSITCGSAAVVMYDILDNEAARVGMLGSSGAISDYDVSLGEIEGVVFESNPAQIVYWKNPISVTLRKERQRPAS